MALSVAKAMITHVIGDLEMLHIDVAQYCRHSGSEVCVKCPGLNYLLNLIQLLGRTEYNVKSSVRRCCRC